MSFKCPYCSRTFSTSQGLKHHISAKHQFIDEESEGKGEASHSKILYKEEPGLWDDDLPAEETEIWNDARDDLPTEDPMVRL